jgi:carbamate kinase
MRIVVALGGNALQRRDEPMTVANQRANVRRACEALAPLAGEHELVISHGNGPQVGLLALQAAAYDDSDGYPFDVLGAQTEGMIGYLIEQELGNLVPFDKPIATLLTMVEVDPGDPAMSDPTKFVGPGYPELEAHRLAAERGWTVRRDGALWRRVVPSPKPLRIFEIRPIRQLLETGTIVICAGGGGIPTMYQEPAGDRAPGPGPGRTLVGVEAVVDKDRSSAVLAHDLAADLLVIATDAAGVCLDYGTAAERLIATAAPESLKGLAFPAGSMGPKVEAVCDFARRNPGKRAAIGDLADLAGIVAGTAGTQVSSEFAALTFR